MIFFDIASYLDESEAISFAAGQKVFEAGDVGGEMYFILSGEVRITIDERELDYLLPGQIFGEMALVDKQVRSATVRVVTPGKLVPIRKELFATLTQKIPTFAIDVMAVMSARLRRYMDDEVNRLRLQEEIAIGEKIQLSLLPEKCPAIPGWAFAASYQAARQVGGDLYDFIPDPLNPELLHLVIADVTGKGVPAAMFMAVCRTIIRGEAQNGRSPANVLIQTNNQLMNERRSLPFLSAFFGTLNLKTGRLVYALGGHDRPYWIQHSTHQIQQLGGQGMLLGAFPTIRIEECEITLARGDSLVLYTDGITEARNGSDFFDEAGLEGALVNEAATTANEIAAHILAAVNQFTGSHPQSDDMTLVIVQRNPVSA
jgi:sigma-B regulation protein RsbU (phosphoserine phosphatase)